MNPKKTTILRFKPIAEITEDEMKEEVLATDGKGNWLQGNITRYSDAEFTCYELEGSCLDEVVSYAVLPKEE